MMSTARYWVAVLTLVSLPPAILLWFFIHPFGRFWRRLGPWATYSILAVPTACLMWRTFLARNTLLGQDFGSSWATGILAVGALACSIRLQRLRRRHLTTAMLSGLPQVSEKHYPGVLLTEGIYGKIRHPRYVEVVCWIGAYALFANYLGTYVLLALTFPFLFLVVLLEERELARRFGEEWESYSQKVPRFIPRVG